MLSALPLLQNEKDHGIPLSLDNSSDLCRVGGRRLTEDKQFRDVHTAQEEEDRRALGESFQRNGVPSLLNFL